jgi:hypothetical protein
MHDHCLYAGLSRGMTVLLTRQPASDHARPSKATMRVLGAKVLQGLGRRLVAAGEVLAGACEGPSERIDVPSNSCR